MSSLPLAVIGAGLLSAGLHLAMALGSFGAVILAYLAPLPLFLVGLSLGFLPTAAPIGPPTIPPSAEPAA